MARSQIIVQHLPFLRRYARNPDDVGRRLRERRPEESVESVLLGTAAPPVVETLPRGGTEETVIGSQPTGA